MEKMRRVFFPLFLCRFLSFCCRKKMRFKVIWRFKRKIGKIRRRRFLPVYVCMFVMLSKHLWFMPSLNGNFLQGNNMPAEVEQRKNCVAKNESSWTNKMDLVSYNLDVVASWDESLSSSFFVRLVFLLLIFHIIFQFYFHTQLLLSFHFSQFSSEKLSTYSCL